MLQNSINAYLRAYFNWNMTIDIQTNWVKYNKILSALFYIMINL